MNILIFIVFVAVGLAIYLLRVAVLKERERKSCLIKAIAVSVSAGALAMLTYFIANGIEFQLGLMLFQLVLFSAVAFGISLLCVLPIYGRRCYLQAVPDRMLEALKEAGK